MMEEFTHDELAVMFNLVNRRAEMARYRMREHQDRKGRSVIIAANWAKMLAQLEEIERKLKRLLPDHLPGLMEG